MRARVLFAALLGSAAGYPALASQLGSSELQPAALVLAPSPYEPGLAPDPFVAPSAMLPAPAARRSSAPALPSQRPTARAVALASSPYELALVPDPYGPPPLHHGISLARAASNRPDRRGLAPSPYESLPLELAPAPY